MDEIKQTILDFGSYAGLAAFIGLAILALLYFSQARDVRRLREWAGRAPERDAEVQQLAAQYASQAVTDALEQMPVAPVGVQQTVEGDVYVAVESDQGEMVDEAPPAVDDEAIEQAVGEPLEQVLAEAEQAAAEPGLPEPEQVEDGMPAQPSLAPEGDVLPEPVQVNGDEPAVVGEDAQSETAEPAIAASAGAAAAEAQQAAPSRRPSTPAAAALYSAAAASARSSSPVVPPPAPGRPPVQFPMDRLGATGESAIVIPPAARSGQRPPKKSGDALIRRMAIVLAGLAVSIGVVFGAVTLFGGDAPTKPGNKPAPSALDSDTRINRTAVRVAVLNGTRVDGLAAVVGGQIEQAGFKLGTVSNAPDHQEHIESVIYYAEGFKQEAREVSKEVAIKPVKQISDTTQSADPEAQVVIVVGADIEQ